MFETIGAAYAEWRSCLEVWRAPGPALPEKAADALDDRRARLEKVILEAEASDLGVLVLKLDLIETDLSMDPDANKRALSALTRVRQDVAVLAARDAAA